MTDLLAREEDKVWSDAAIDYNAGLVITDPRSHERGTFVLNY